MRRTTKKRKTPEKGVTLNGDWLRNTKEVKECREQLILSQEGLCAISGIDMTSPCLDHTHEGGIGTDGKVRGVLQSEVNMLEGRYLKLFSKLKLDKKYGINFPEFLINMGLYLQKDNSSNKLHPKYMEDFRKKIKRLTKGEIQRKLLSESNLTSNGDKKELVRLYVQTWVDKQ